VQRNVRSTGAECGIANQRQIPVRRPPLFAAWYVNHADVLDAESGQRRSHILRRGPLGPRAADTSPVQYAVRPALLGERDDITHAPQNVRTVD